MFDDSLVGLFEGNLVHLLLKDKIRITNIDHLYPAHHLAYNHLDMLVIDPDTLQPVNLLDLIDQVFGQSHLTLDLENILRNRRAADQRFTGPDVVSLVHIDMLAARNQIFLLIADVDRGNRDLLLALLGALGD